jgi:hypothetical protein
LSLPAYRNLSPVINLEMPQMRYSILGSVILFAALCGPVLAQDAAGAGSDAAAEARGKVRAACAADAEKFCAGVERGKGGGMRACFAAHESELSADCKAARTERAAARAKERG